MISVIIIQYNNSRLTHTAIESFRKYHSCNYEIILVDNGSTEPNAVEFAKNIPNLKLICLDTNLGFGRANNLAVHKSLGDVLLFLNNDTITTSDFISKIETEFYNDSSIGIIGPKLCNSDGSLQLSHGKLPSIFIECADKVIYSLVDKKNKLVTNYLKPQYEKKTSTEWVTGAALFIKKKLFQELNGFDESFFMYFEDKDLCKRVIDSGGRVVFFPESSLIHLRGASLNEPNRKFLNKKYRESQMLYYRKHKTKFEQMLLKAYLKISGKTN
jgi:GT2 family glycosyltransferase